jgi:hypothetical protein
MSATTAPHRIRVKVGNAEFDAEGAEDTVKSHFEQFMSLVASLPASMTNPVEQNGDGKENNNRTAESVVSERQAELLERAFRVDGEQVSLRVLPPTNGTRDADALVVLLYGFLRLVNQQEVSASGLMAAARQSGIQRDRIDRTVPVEFTNRGGHRKGVRYSLNNRGITRAEELLENMFN